MIDALFLYRVLIWSRPDVKILRLVAHKLQHESELHRIGTPVGVMGLYISLLPHFPVTDTYNIFIPICW